MTLSEMSVRRPVLATVVCLLLVLGGLMSLSRLGVRELPLTDQPVISVETTYRGASAAVVETRITQPIEEAMAGIEGIDKIVSSSADEISRITIEFSLDRELGEAASDVRDRISRLTALLPQEADAPRVLKSDGGSAIAYVNLRSDRLSVMELTDYAERNVLDRYAALPGVSRASIVGARRPAMRIWPDPQAMTARGLTVADLEAALRRENLELPAGRIESLDREFTLRTDTRLTSGEQFKQLVVARGLDGHLVRLGEVAEVRLAAENERSAARYEGLPGINMMIEQQSTANALEVTDAVQRVTGQISASLPPHLQLRVITNNGAYIRASLREVMFAIAFSLACVTMVMFAFVGSWRATAIPALTIPVSAIAAAIFMYAAGYSINTLTLLAIALAIGLVVDDAIVVLENIHRRIENGEPHALACVNGANEIRFAVIATTLVLVAVFVPLAFLTGPVGRLFGEFSLTLAASILISCFVSLTLVPMLSSKLLRPGVGPGRVGRSVDALFKRVVGQYRLGLRWLLPRAGWLLTGTLVAAAGSVLLFTRLQSEAMPIQDGGFVSISLIGPEGASFEYMDEITRTAEAIIRQLPESDIFDRVYSSVPSPFVSGRMNVAAINVGLVDFALRDRSAMEVASDLQNHLAPIPGARIVATAGSRGTFGGNAQQAMFVVQGADYDSLAQWRDLLLPAMAENPGFQQVEADYQERQPQMLIQVDRDRAAELGVSVQALGHVLETLLGSRIVTTFVQGGREYNVVMQGRVGDRATPQHLDNFHVRSDRTGKLIPVENLARLQETTGARELKRFDRLRSITLTARLKDGYSQGDAVDFMRQLVATRLPEGAILSFDGATREYMRSSRELYWVFGWATLVVFLVLAAQFESYTSALVIMSTVPLAVMGAIWGMHALGVTVNIYSQIAAVLLIGLAAKNGVLIVEFANQLRDAGTQVVTAIIDAAATRLRPVLMTSFCAIGGALPLYLAHGAGAEARYQVGVVVIFGVGVSLVLTLVIVPVVYSLLARRIRYSLASEQPGAATHFHSAEQKAPA